MSELDIWGGIECTVNRVRDRWHDQLELTGHANRIDDLDLIAELGIRTLRYPVLWERTAPESPFQRHWEWADRRLERIRSLNIDPIIGLLHHGSGPHYTHLLDAGFPTALASFAAGFATRYPWVRRYTPINEPMTTARFSALYGLWYPHHRDDRSFARALVNQCKATALCMAAIRRVTPEAQLVQTEDLGTTHSTARLAYQREFENERRWLTWDLLCGRVSGHHALRPFLLRSGVRVDELDWFVANPCPPQVIGINHYVTSDRYLDERLGLYPPSTHGGNSLERYADVDAVRVLHRQYGGWNVIREAGARYGLPVALTEVHLGCTREEQIRWLHEARVAARQAKHEGCDVIAVTAWALFGSYNWNTLLTATDGTYEPGAFDVRGALPRPTAVAKYLQRSIAAGSFVDDQDFSPGWWQRADKVIYRGSPVTAFVERGRRSFSPRPLLICGAGGALGGAFQVACAARGLPYISLARAELELSDEAAVRAVCGDTKPWAIINASGFARVDQAEGQATQCFRDNVDGSYALATVANDRQIPFLTFSSDLVFDGCQHAPYLESSRTGPLNTYGKSKVAAEVATLQFPRTLCVRTAGFFGASNRSDFLSDALRTLRHRKKYAVLNDVTISPTYLPDLTDACLDVLHDGCTGLLHLVNRGAVTWSAFLEQGASALAVDTRTMQRSSLAEIGLPARRPIYSALSSERMSLMPTLEDALARYSRTANARASDNGPTERQRLYGGA